jgi:hypothetical protein
LAKGALTQGSTDDWQKVADVAPDPLNTHPAIQKSIQDFHGQLLGTNEKGNPVYQKGNTKYVICRVTINTTIRVFASGYTEDAELPSGAYTPQINQLIADKGGLDPWTNKPFVDANGKPLSVADMTDDQKVAFAGRIHAWDNSKPVDPSLIGDLNNQRQMVDTFQKMHYDMAQLNNDDFSKVNAIKKGLADWNEGDWVDTGLGSEKRRALVDLQAQIDQLKSLGQATLGRKEAAKTGAIEAPKVDLIAENPETESRECFSRSHGRSLEPRWFSQPLKKSPILIQ